MNFGHIGIVLDILLILFGTFIFSLIPSLIFARIITPRSPGSVCHSGFACFMTENSICSNRKREKSTSETKD